LIYFNDSSYTVASLKKQFRIWSKRLHPDTGGTKEKFQDLQREYEYAKNFLVGAKAIDEITTDIVRDSVNNKVTVEQTYNDWDSKIKIKLPQEVYDSGFVLQLNCNQLGIKHTFNVRANFERQDISLNLTGRFFTVEFD